MSAQYTFFSWTRSGLGQHVVPPNGSNRRGTVEVAVKLNGTTITSSGGQELQLVGPGDIKALDTRNIIRQHPEPHTGNFESNYLAFIEFYQDTFLWDYTPEQHSGNKLKPWLFLLVLEESEYTLTENPDGLDYLDINGGSPSSFFPPDNELHAWAHVHVNAPTADIDDLASKLSSNPDFATARLLSPRRLEPNKSYQAFLVPVYEIGRKTGLGLDITETGTDALKTAWEDGNARHPVYYNWGFQTGAKGDFESLVRELVPTPASQLDGSIGLQPIDLTTAGEPYQGISPPTALTDHQFPLGGALRPPQINNPAFPDQQWQAELINVLNLGTQQQLPDYDPNAGDPIIVPPTYGHWHALVHELNKGDEALLTTSIDNSDSEWLHALNLNPAHRVSAGLGTKIVKKNQDKYLETAWKQIGSVLEANQLLMQSQLGIEIAVRWWEKHVTTLENGEVINLLSPVLDSTHCSGQAVSNVQLNLEQSSIPVGVVSPSFRRLSSLRGRIARKQKRRTKLPHYKYRSALESLTEGHIHYKIPPDFTTDGKDYAPRDKDDPSQYLIPCQQAVIIPQQTGKDVPWPVFSFEPDHGQLIIKDNHNEVISAESISEVWHSWVNAINCNQDTAGPLPSFDLGGIMACVLKSLHPSETIKVRTLTRIGTEADLDAIVPIMAAPDYPQPMYKALAEESTDFILPNLHKLPNNSITLMEANQPFIEAFMVGLNYEMANELLWNEYPTDRRGSYFRQFWDVSQFVNKSNLSAQDLAEKLKDIDFIHRWIKWTDLGDHRMSNHNPADGPAPTTAPLVLTIRGDLLNRYPETMIFAIQADTGKVFKPSQATKYPIFSARIQPDITFVGFELELDEATGLDGGEGWFFCLKEPPGGPRFGLDIDEGSTNAPSYWNDLHWGHIDNANLIRLDASGTTFVNTTPLTASDTENDAFSWGQSSADMANILYQVPVMIAVHASQMI